MDSVCLLLAVVIICVLYIYGSKKSKTHNLPGPAGYPIVGNALNVDFKYLHLKFFEWSKTYGDIYKISLLGKRAVVINSSKLLRELFSHEPNATLSSGRPDSFCKTYIMSNSDVGFSSPDKQWTKRRKVMYQLLHAYGEGLRNLEEEINLKLSEIKGELCKCDQTTCDPKELVEDFVISIIEILLVGKSRNRGSDFHKYLIELDDKINVVVNPGVDMLYKNFPVLLSLPFSTSKTIQRFFELRNGLMDFLDRQSDEKSIGIYHNMKNALEREDGIRDNSWLTELTMQVMIVDIVVAGFLTTRGTLLSLLQILMCTPAIQVKLQREVDRVIGHGRQPTAQDRSEMPYCEAVVLETLRYISHVPLSLLHSAADDIYFEDFHIPKDTMIIPNLWAMHHSEKEWKDPFHFNPERFLDDEGQLIAADSDIRKQIHIQIWRMIDKHGPLEILSGQQVRNKSSSHIIQLLSNRFMAFGFGKRSCIGEVFAKIRIFLFLVSLMQVCTVRPPAGTSPSILDPRQMLAGAAMNPYPYKCTFEKRTFDSYN